MENGKNSGCREFIYDLRCWILRNAYVGYMFIEEILRESIIYVYKMNICGIGNI